LRKASAGVAPRARMPRVPGRGEIELTWF